MDIGDICDYCEENDCMHCYYGNSCIGCDDYDADKETCKSNGACGAIMMEDEKKDDN